jgi:hypothetical protein
MRQARKGCTPLLSHKSAWLDCFVYDKKLRRSSMYYALKKSEVSLDGACNNLIKRYIIPLNITGRILSLNTLTVNQLRNNPHKLTISDADIIATE